MNKLKKHFLGISIFLILIIVLGLFLLVLSDFSRNHTLLKNNTKDDIHALFQCVDDKVINVTFYLSNDTMILILSDSRTLSLSRVISGSGARYANSDESFVFWNKGDAAFITENDTITYQDCLNALE